MSARALSYINFAFDTFFVAIAPEMMLEASPEALSMGTGRTVIGKMEDLEVAGALRPGEKTLDLPDQGGPKANWEQNSSKLREGGWPRP